jgi:hypothetical protein
MLRVYCSYRGAYNSDVSQTRGITVGDLVFCNAKTDINKRKCGTFVCHEDNNRPWIVLSLVPESEDVVVLTGTSLVVQIDRSCLKKHETRS